MAVRVRITSPMMASCRAVHASQPLLDKSDLARVSEPIPTGLDSRTRADTDLHFTCFVAAPSEAKRDALTSGVDPSDSGKQVELSAAKSGMRLIELDGGRMVRLIGVNANLLRVRCERYDVRRYLILLASSSDVT
jgi:hypothetical protein